MRSLPRLLFTSILLLLPLLSGLMAQPGGGQPPCWPPPCIPIDGGIGLLAAAGAVIGGRSAWRSRRSRKAKS